MNTPNTQTLTATVREIRYPRESTTNTATWYILATDKGTCKGELRFRPRSGDTLQLEGRHTTYKGERQFAFTVATLRLPTSPRDRLHYVCTRTRGCGSAMEDVIWGFAGNRWESIAEDVVPRLKGKLYDAFREQIDALAEKEGEASVVATLLGKGLTQKMADRAYEKWQGETLGVVDENCYKLATLDNYSFVDVDRTLRHSFGVGDGDSRRIKAGVLYALRRLTDGGDTVVEWDALAKEATRLLGGFSGRVVECSREMFAHGELMPLPDQGCVALVADFESEMDVWRFAGLVAKNKNEKTA